MQTFRTIVNIAITAHRVLHKDFLLCAVQSYHHCFGKVVSAASPDGIGDNKKSIGLQYITFMGKLTPWVLSWIAVMRLSLKLTHSFHLLPFIHWYLDPSFSWLDEKARYSLPQMIWVTDLHKPKKEGVCKPAGSHNTKPWLDINAWTQLMTQSTSYGTLKSVLLEYENKALRADTIIFHITVCCFFFKRFNINISIFCTYFFFSFLSFVICYKYVGIHILGI